MFCIHVMIGYVYMICIMLSIPVVGCGDPFKKGDEERDGEAAFDPNVLNPKGLLLPSLPTVPLSSKRDACLAFAL